jgi:hypothetical protein
VADGDVPPKAVADLSKRLVGASTSLSTSELVDAVWSVAVCIGVPNTEPARERLGLFVRALSSAGTVLPQTFHKLLDEELLDLTGFINAHMFTKRMTKINTDQVYRQHKYNLLHEETEGYSKVKTLFGWQRRIQNVLA